MNASRPDPDQLLAQVQSSALRAARGRLTIFFGANAGVGKTYAMLEAAQRLHREGRDVVVGYVELHGRPETERLLSGLEQLPPLMVNVGTGLRREFNLDAALARKPELLLVDELAHTNLSAAEATNDGEASAPVPGETAQPIHRDQWAFDFFPFPPGYEVQCNTIWAMTDFTEENGGTRVVVGSNAGEDRLSFGPDDTEPAVMDRGSVLCYSGSVYHGGGANRSATTRLGLNITYNVAWLRQEENQYLSVPRQVAETLPTDLLRLMGYDRGAYALGYIDDLRDPIEAVRPGLGTTGFGIS